MVDTFGHNRYCGRRIVVKKLWETEEKGHGHREGEDEDEEEEEDGYDSERPAIRSASRPSAKQRDPAHVRIQQNQQWLRLMSPNLGGFSFTLGIWGKWRTVQLVLVYSLTIILGLFNVDKLEPISWNSEAIDRLVFPEEQKDLLLSFVINYNQSIAHSDDPISGKGKTTSVSSCLCKITVV